MPKGIRTSSLADQIAASQPAGPGKKPNPVDVHIGNRIRMRRMSLHLSQEKLANALGLTFQQVQKYEKGANRVGGSRMMQIATFLQVPPAYFYEGAPGHEKTASYPPVAESPLLSSREGIRLAEAFPHIADIKMRWRLVELVELIAGLKPMPPNSSQSS